MRRTKCWQVDAFTNRPFTGNPAAVCWLEEAKGSAWMQAVAREMNLSETAFVRQLAQDYELRWFTPTAEVDLCGHATLATAHVLWTAELADPHEPIRFHTRSGMLTTRLSQDFIELDFPALPAREVSPPNGLLQSLGVKPRFVGRTQFD